jgi:hypothetical protein
VLTAVNEISIEEDPVLCRGKTTDLECSKEVVKLAVKIADDAKIGVIRNFDVCHSRRLRLEEVPHFCHYSICILVMKPVKRRSLDHE